MPQHMIAGAWKRLQKERTSCVGTYMVKQMAELGVKGDPVDPVHGYSTTEHLLFMLVDEARAAAWQRAGKRHAKKPKPISPMAKSNAKRHGHVPEGKTPQQVQSLLAKVGSRRETVD